MLLLRNELAHPGDRLANGSQILDAFVRNLNTELVFQSKHNVYAVERIDLQLFESTV